MLSKDENFYSMARNVAALLDDVQDWQSIPKFVQYAKTLNDLLSDVGNEKEQAEIVTTGATEDKHNAKSAAATMAVDLAKRTLSFAKDTNDRKLYDELNISKDAIVKKHDAEALSKLRAMAQKMKPLLSQLLDYGVDPKELEALQDANEVFRAMLDAPRQLIIKRKEHNNTIFADHIPAIRDLLDSMDNLVNKFKGTEFEKRYQSARMVIDHGSRRNDKGKGDDNGPENEPNE